MVALRLLLLVEVERTVLLLLLPELLRCCVAELFRVLLELLLVAGLAVDWRVVLLLRCGVVTLLRLLPELLCVLIVLLRSLLLRDVTAGAVVVWRAVLLR
ncbi:MAG: hypothetical protein PHQ24_06915, partial [Proteiniphilum sp.]|nr:hypothetical protein [Proteiniphilum sp.]